MGELYNPFPKLPKNIRQIGERDQIVKLYIEDYVNTYLKRLYPKHGQALRVGLLLGTVEDYEGTPYIFVDGALEMEDVAEDGEHIMFSEAAWKKAYQEMEKMFPKRTIQGWFICGSSGSQLSPLNYWKQHGQYFAEKNQLMYLNSGLEGEEAIYITSQDGFYKLRGHSIYYERNQMMQDYMVLRKDVRRIESGTRDNIIRDFRQKMDDNKTQFHEKKQTISVLRVLCSVLSIVVFAGGVVMFNNYEKMRKMESVIASVVPMGFETETEKSQEDMITIEEVGGQVLPIVPEETMAQTLPETIPVTVPEESQTTTAVTEAETTKEAEPAVVIPENAETYIVGDGETLFGICFKVYGNLNNLDELCRINGLDDQNRIIAGQELILP